MGTKPKTITLKEELIKKLQDHHSKYGSTDSGVINLALEKYFEELKKKQK